MSIRDTFLNGVETAFTTFNEAVKSGVFTVETDDGFTDPTIITDNIRCIFEKFEAKDVELLTFSELIQPKDIKGLVPFVDLINCEVSTQAYIMFDLDKYIVEGHNIDPMNVLYTFLLRKV